MLYFCAILLILSGFWLFSSNYKHLLTMLLSLEVMVLGLFCLMMHSFYLGDYDYKLMVYLVFVVCESSIGLGLLVSFVRIYGNDFVSQLSSLWC